MEAWKCGKPLRRRSAQCNEAGAVNEKITPVEDTEIRDYDQCRPPDICQAPEWALDSDLCIDTCS